MGVDYENLESVITFAKALAKANPRFLQFVVKYQDRENYNITMQLQKALEAGAELVWWS